MSVISPLICASTAFAAEDIVDAAPAATLVEVAALVDVPVVEAPAVEVEAVVPDVAAIVLKAVNFSAKADIKEAMLESTDLLSNHAEDLLNIKVGRSTLQVVEVANKMYDEAMELSAEAKALSAFETPDEERTLILQVSEAARLMAAIAKDIALKEQARLGQSIILMKSE